MIATKRRNGPVPTFEEPRKVKYSLADVRATLAAVGISPNSEIAFEILEQLRPLGESERVHDRYNRKHVGRPVAV